MTAKRRTHAGPRTCAWRRVPSNLLQGRSRPAWTATLAKAPDDGSNPAELKQSRSSPPVHPHPSFGTCEIVSLQPHLDWGKLAPSSDGTHIMASVSNAFADVPPEELCSADYAKAQDASDLKGLHHQEGVRRPVVHRQEFVIPTKGEVRAGKSGNVTETDMSGNGGHGDDDADEAVYLCGHSLGLQPRRRCEKLPSDTSTCETADGVDGKPNANAQDEASWLHQDVVIREQMAKIVGALPDEVALMYSSMTMNMHFALQNLYQPTKGRYRIIIESSMLSSYRVSPHSPGYGLGRDC